MIKKGQTEDIFGDLMFAIILIIITVGIISTHGESRETSVKTLAVSGMSSLRNIDLITLLRSPVNSPLLDANGYKGARFSDLFEIAARNYPDKKQEYGWIFGKLFRTDMVAGGIFCTDEFIGMMTQRLGYRLWSFNVYDTNNMDKIFQCDNIGKDYPRRNALLEGSLAYANLTMPTSNPDRDIIIEMESIL